MEPGANLENVAARMEAASLECTSLRTSAADKLLCDDEGLGSTGGNDGQQGYPAAGSLAEMTSEVLRYPIVESPFACSTLGFSARFHASSITSQSDPVDWHAPCML